MFKKTLGKYCVLLIITSAITSVVACKNYSVRVNDNLVYTPPSLFSAFAISDSHLHDCVEQTISDKHITKAEDLKQLNCSHAGITKLDGLEKFSALEQLNLGENLLVTVPQLSHLTQLKVLILHKNNLTNAEPLLHLLHLTDLDISDNNNLSCGEVKQLRANFSKKDLVMLVPKQCEMMIK